MNPNPPSGARPHWPPATNPCGLLWYLHAFKRSTNSIPPRPASLPGCATLQGTDVKSYGRNDRIPHLRPLASAADSRDSRPSAGNSIRSKHVIIGSIAGRHENGHENRAKGTIVGPPHAHQRCEKHRSGAQKNQRRRNRRRVRKKAAKEHRGV